MDHAMIEVFTANTPNGIKVPIALEELGVPYDLRKIALGSADLRSAEYLRINPNAKIPAIRHLNGSDAPVTVFESGAILLYLASKTGKLLPKSDRAKFKTLEWLMFQMGGFGPMLGQNHHFRLYAPQKIDYAIERYTNEAKRLYGVLDQRLEKNKYIVGNEYTIADMAIFPWTRRWDKQGMDLADYPHFKRWFEMIGKRPAVKRAVEILTNLRKPEMDKKDKEQLFGASQYKRRKS